MAGPSLPPPRRPGIRRPLLVGLVYALAVIATTAIIGGTVLVATRTVLFNDVRDYAGATVETAAALVDANTLALFTRADQDRSAEYTAAVRPLYALDSVGRSLRHVYAVSVAGDSMRYALDAAPRDR